MKWLSRTAYRDGDFSITSTSLAEGKDAALFEVGVARLRGEWTTVAVVIWRLCFTFSVSTSAEPPAPLRRLRVRLGRYSISMAASIR
jgi:hypothetical protein